MAGPILVMLCAAAAGWAQAPAGAVLVRDVSVVDARKATAAAHRDVLIRGERIAEVRPAGSVRVTAGMTVVDGKGRYLIPGLWDMHTHTLRAERIPTWFPLFVANGVTGIRDMGSPLPPEEVAALKEGKVAPGPRIYWVGKVLGGWNEDQGITASTAEEGRRAVRQLKAGGSDFIKVYTMLPREVFFAVADEAKKAGIAVVGHVPLTVTLAEAGAAGMKSFEHSYGLLEACSTREAALRAEIERAPAGAANAAAAWGAIVQATDRAYGEDAAAGGYSESKCARLGQTLKADGVWQCPTLTVRRAFAMLNDRAFTEDPLLRFIARPMRARWAATLTADDRSRGVDERGFANRRVRLEQEGRMTVTLMRNGVPVLAGTDCGNPFLVPGFSLHNELELLVKAGLTPGEALAAATVNAARFLGREADFGAVDAGKIADLVLLGGNPLTDIGNTRKIEAVILGGKIHDRAALDGMLAHVESMAR